MPKIAIVHKNKCNPQGCGGYLCIRVCPVNRMGKECITIDPVDKKVKIDESLTTSACSICQNCCPFGAIEIINLPEEKTHTPIHQYGRNGFHLYNLPTPVFGKVVGIVGRNGIGKSTALKILSGSLMPNLGQEKEVSYTEVLKFFKGSEMQSYFEQLKKGRIKASFKPQMIDLIPKSVKGKVGDLLRKVDERSAFDEVVGLLDLKGILKTSIADISGGELQRVAIAATALKKANLYIFDEPTSYLDIKQRLAVAKFIRSLANPDSAVIVVEHDLIVLDAMSDTTHILYGKEDCYGIVSLPMTTKHGINTYLDGYIREEKMRFRNHALKFVTPQEKTLKKAVELTSWEKLEKGLKGFHLSADKGMIPKNQCVGILGENGIGKTTFVKLFAGVLSLDKGKITQKVKVSYKPQYLESDSSALVSGVLESALARYETQLIRPLGIKELLTKKLNELSGGELQRVAIAHCLSQDADLYMLDEPSAFLDVEQRIEVGKVIRSVVELTGCSVVVVDHDLLFINYLSDQLLIFDGVPAKNGSVHGPFLANEGMNRFLKGLEITMRRDAESNRPRVNDFGSRLDREQKEKGIYFA